MTKLLLPHQLVEHKVRSDFDRDIRRRFFKGLEFDGPEGDPGWFGPGSAVWHVHSHTSALIFGLQCAAFIERLDPSIFWMGSDHSRLVERDEKGNADRSVRPGGLPGAAGALAWRSSSARPTAPPRTAEKMTQTVRAMHHTIKGIRPDGLPYDADDPEWLRWNYATVVWGIATAHELYHPMPLRDIDRYYREFVRVGHALGGTDLPATKAETLECLRSYLPRLALTHGAALSTGPSLMNNPEVPQAAKFFDWAIRDAMPDWAAELISHRRRIRSSALLAGRPPGLRSTEPAPQWASCPSFSRPSGAWPRARSSTTPSRPMFSAAIPCAAATRSSTCCDLRHWRTSEEHSLTFANSELPAPRSRLAVAL